VGNQQHKRPDANVDRVQMLACLSVSWWAEIEDYAWD
jgi:hypothetical protein